MADSFVEVTEGSGKTVDTRTEATNGNHRQVIIIGDPATNAGVAPVDATAGLKVDLGADNDITGTVTANAGTNLNTSALALEAGNLASIKAKTDNIPALGQALAAASTPVVLTAAQLTTLTPPAAITGFATAANQLADGHNVTVDNASGASAVNIQDGGNTITVDGTVAVTNAALTELAAAINTDKLDVNIKSSDVASGGTSAADDADFTAGTTSGTPAMGVYESTPTSVTDGDLGTVGITSGRRMKTSATIDAALPSGTNNIGDVDVLSSALPTGASTSAKQDTIIGHVDGLEALIGTTNTNTGAATTALQIMDDWDNGASDGASVSGDVAHDTADAGEPVKIGLKAVALKANPTEVAANDRTNWYADVSGIPFVLPGHMNTLSQGFQVTDADGAQTDAAIITAGANVSVVVTKVSVMADGANTGDVSVRIGFGTANTPAVDAAQVLLFHPGIKAGSGVVEGSGSGILGIGASGEDVRITCEDPAGGSVSVIVTYFTTEI